jgi:GAF domain-containing protein
MLTARQRARERLWASSAERVEILATLTELFACEHLSCEQAVRESAVVLAEVLDDAVHIHRVSDDLRWMRAVASHHPQEREREVLAGLAGRLFRADQGFSAGVLDTGDAVLVPRVTALEIEVLQPELAPACTELGTRGFVVAPMTLRGRISGLVAQCRTRPEPPLNVDDRLFLEEVGMRLALGIASRPEAAQG